MRDWWYTRPVVIASGFGALVVIIALGWVAAGGLR